MLGGEVARVAPPGVKLVWADRGEMDITDIRATRAFINDCGARGIINCSAYTAVDAAETDRAAAYAINACGARNLAIACREIGARLLHLSTDFVFDGSAREPYAEYDIPNPRGVYAESKLAGEIEIQTIGGDWQIVRTQWLYGQNGKHFVAAIAKLARERERLTVVGDQHGCPTCTWDLAPLLWRLLLEAPGGIYHASGGGACTWHEFAAEIATLAGSSARVDPITTQEWNRIKPSTAPRPAYSVLSKDRLKRTIGYQFPHWRDSLRAFFERGDLDRSRA